MALKNIRSASFEEMKRAQQADHDPTHIHYQVIRICALAP